MWSDDDPVDVTLHHDPFEFVERPAEDLALTSVGHLAQGHASDELGLDPLALGELDRQSPRVLVRADDEAALSRRRDPSDDACADTEQQRHDEEQQPQRDRLS